MAYRDDLAAAREATVVLSNELVKEEARTRDLQRQLDKIKEYSYQSTNPGPSTWDKFWATSWMKTMLSGFVFVNLLWIVWAHYAGQPEKEELRKLQLQHDGLKVKMDKRAILIMLEAGRLTVDIGDKRVLQSIPLDGDFERVLKTTTPSISDDITFRFTAKKDGPDLDPEINYHNLCASLRSLDEDITALEELDKKSLEYEKAKAKAER